MMIAFEFNSAYRKHGLDAHESSSPGQCFFYPADKSTLKRYTAKVWSSIPALTFCKSRSLVNALADCHRSYTAYTSVLRS
jgi:hypothetical protein